VDVLPGNITAEKQRYDTDLLCLKEGGLTTWYQFYLLIPFSCSADAADILTGKCCRLTNTLTCVISPSLFSSLLDILRLQS